MRRRGATWGRAACRDVLLKDVVEVLGLLSACALDVRTRKEEHQVETEGIISGQAEREASE